MYLKIQKQDTFNVNEIKTLSKIHSKSFLLKKVSHCSKKECLFIGFWFSKKALNFRIFLIKSLKFHNFGKFLVYICDASNSTN